MKKITPLLVLLGCLLLLGCGDFEAEEKQLMAKLTPEEQQERLRSVYRLPPMATNIVEIKYDDWVTFEMYNKCWLYGLNGIGSSQFAIIVEAPCGKPKSEDVRKGVRI